MQVKYKFIFYSFLSLAFIGMALFTLKESRIKNPVFLIKNNIKISLEVANTEKSREFGLMYRKTMPKDHGMLFVFEKPAILRFWMKNTLIPLDMIFLNQHKVIAIFNDVPPCKSNDCPTYGPNEYADEVIELNAGMAKKLKIKYQEINNF